MMNPSKQEEEQPATELQCSEQDSLETNSHFSTDVLRDTASQQTADEQEFEVNQVSRRSRIIQACILNEMTEDDFDDVNQDRSKTDKDVEYIIKQINSLVLFQAFEDEELKSVIEYMYKRKVDKGEVVIKQGDIGDAFFVVRSGKYECTESQAGKSSLIKTYNGSGYFGDLALVNHAPRAATITALTDGEVWVLNATRFVWLKKRQAEMNAECFEQVIRKIPMFSNNLTDSLVNKLIDAIEMITLHKGDVICKQGDPGDAMYFILVGRIGVSVGGTQVRVMGVNEFFGERALILDEGRAATCTALEDLKLAKLPKESFEMLIPNSVVASMRDFVAKSYKNPEK